MERATNENMAVRAIARYLRFLSVHAVGKEKRYQ
jgi:hypothetical protein